MTSKLTGARYATFLGRGVAEQSRHSWIFDPNSLPCIPEEPPSLTLPPETYAVFFLEGVNWVMQSQFLAPVEFFKAVERLQ